MIPNNRMYKVRDINWREIYTYFKSNPVFLTGLFFDFLVFPFVLFAFLIKRFIIPNKDLDSYFPRDPSLKNVLLIHGSGANEVQWLLPTYLYLKDKFNVYTIQLNNMPANPEESIQYYTDKIHTKVEQIRKEYPNNKTLLVGHSMGGLVAANYIKQYKPTEVKYIVTIGTPFKGAPLLKHLSLGTKRHTEMTPNSKFLCENLFDGTGNYQYLCFGSPYDFQVPFENSFPDFTESNVRKRVYPYGHTSAILGPFIWRYVCSLR